MEKMKTPPRYWKVKASPIVVEYFTAHDCNDFGPYDWYGKDKNNYDAWDNACEIKHLHNLPTLTQAQFKKHFYDPWKAGQAGVSLDDFLTIQEASKQMGLTVKDLHAMTNQSKIPFTKIKGRLYFHRNDVNSFPRFTTTANVQALKAIGGSKQQIIVTPADGMDAEVCQEGNVIKARSVPKRTRTDSKRVTLAKHNRITAELQRQCDYLQSLKQADQARIAQLESDRAEQHRIILNLTDRNNALRAECNQLNATMGEKQARIGQLLADRERLVQDLEKSNKGMQLLRANYEADLATENKRAWQNGALAALFAALAFVLALAQFASL